MQIQVHTDNNIDGYAQLFSGIVAELMTCLAVSATKSRASRSISAT